MIKLIEADIFLTPQALAKLSREMAIFRRHYPDGEDFRWEITPYDREEIISEEPVTSITLLADLPVRGTTVMRGVRVGPAFWEKIVKIPKNRGY